MATNLFCFVGVFLGSGSGGGRVLVVQQGQPLLARSLLHHQPLHHVAEGLHGDELSARPRLLRGTLFAAHDSVQLRGPTLGQVQDIQPRIGLQLVVAQILHH